jgi:dTDP-4-amino-4,6-dideoxygalactose transaminase
MLMHIPFNRIYLTGNEEKYLALALKQSRVTGNGKFSTLCTVHLGNSYNFNSVHLTTSCTAALETAALLLSIQPGDEVIVPSYTFVSSANAFVLRGAKIIFADSGNGNPNVDADAIEALITSRTKAIVVVHYAGIACNMDMIMEIANTHHIPVVEDAAHSIDSYYKEKPLGSIGSLATFSFHETKNITSGEGGALMINDKEFCERAEIILDKGTNRKAFAEGKTDKYEWVDIGSSYRMSELSAAFLLAQLEATDTVQKIRKSLWNAYYEGLKTLDRNDLFSLPVVPNYARHNASVFYMVCASQVLRDKLINGLSTAGISAAFHYQPLHLSPFYKTLQNKSVVLANAEKYGSCLLRLPLHANLNNSDVEYVIQEIRKITAN